MSQEVDDVLVSHALPLVDVLRFRVPHCCMPAPEASQARITPTYHEDRGEAREYLRGALVARKEAGYVDCSTCPERLIFDYLWLDATPFLADSKEPTNPFVDQWTYAESQETEKWKLLTHVDMWSVAQVVQRKGVDSEFSLLEMAARDPARRVWPVSMVRHPVPNVASSNAVQKVLDQYPWADSGLKWKGTMVFKEQPGEDRSTLFDSAKEPGPNPPSGPSSSGKDAVTCMEVYLYFNSADTPQTCFCFSGCCWVQEGLAGSVALHAHINSITLQKSVSRCSRCLQWERLAPALVPWTLLDQVPDKGSQKKR